MAIITIPLIYSCYCEDLGEVTTEERSLSEFSKIDVSSVANLYLHKADEYRVFITTHINLLDDLKTNVRNGELKVDLKNNHGKIKTLNIDVYAPTYERIRMDGVGEIAAFETISTPRFDLIHNGVGNTRIEDLQADLINIHVNGVGDIEMGGNVEDLKADLDGDGNLRLFDLEARNAEFVINGVADIETYVTDNLKVELNGTGDLYYIGDPKLDLHKNGVGKIRKLD